MPGATPGAVVRELHRGPGTDDRRPRPRARPARPRHDDGTQQTAPTEAPKPGGSPQPQGTGPITAGGEKPKPQPKGKTGTSLGQPRADDVKPTRLPKGKTRASDGSPTIDNPTFSLADAGPAPIGVPNFFIEKFRIPPFLLPIYQAAGTEYGIPWQVLAAINEIETDYGRNLSVSSAGALGWMQFIPSSWATYGVDANGDGKKDPYNPVDAIFAAARYLRAAGGDKDINQAIFAYNHADWYVAVRAPARQAHRRHARRPRRLAHRPHRGPLPRRRPRHLRRRPQPRRSATQPRAVGQRRRRRSTADAEPARDQHLLARRRAGRSPSTTA